MSLHSHQDGRVALDGVSAPVTPATPTTGAVARVVSAVAALPVRRSVPGGEEKMGRRLQNKVTIVSGAANGIGQAISRRFAEEGAWVLVTDIDADSGRATVESIRSTGGQAEFARVDIGSRDEIDRAVKLAADRFGRVDVLCNNAAFIGQWHDVLNATEEE